MNIEKVPVERLHLKSYFYENVLRGYAHLMLVKRNKIYEICKILTACSQPALNID